ncbi:MAG: type VI secretion system contractile sheath large subunit [Planctomycetes bacterium]|nr:type VI secretion system contractile sheath large subunit [Planctomycetota bacterium]
MSPEQKREGESRPSPAEEVSVLEKVLAVTPAAERDRVKTGLEVFIDSLVKGTTSWDKSVTRTLERGIQAIDAKVSQQLAAIMHAPQFQKLEGTWRGFQHLVFNSETSAQLKIKVLNIPKTELFKDLDKAVEFDQSQAFKKLYENEFGMPGGEPYGALIGDYEFTNHPEDLAMLTKMSGVAAAAFCPFITAASPGLFGFTDFTELSRPRDLEKLFDTVEYAAWESYRDTEDSRFVTLVMPRVLARLPYGQATKPAEGFNFEEVALDTKGRAKKVPHDQFCWMNASYVMGAKLTEAFAENGWCTAIRGVENGGKVEGLPAYTFTSDDGDVALQCPTEIGITDRRSAELDKLGFLPLCHFKKTDYAVFFGAQTTQKAKDYGPRNTNATANAAICARLPYIMAASRIAHYLKVIGRDKIGAFLERSECQDWLTNWIKDYICADPKPSADMKAKYPLAEASITVQEVPGKPGCYDAVAHLRPWLQMEELTTSIRLVARIPQLAK